MWQFGRSMPLNEFFTKTCYIRRITNPEKLLVKNKLIFFKVQSNKGK